VFKKEAYESVQAARDALVSLIEKKIDQDNLPPNRLVQLLALGMEYEEIIKNGGRRP